MFAVDLPNAITGGGDGVHDATDLVLIELKAENGFKSPFVSLFEKQLTPQYQGLIRSEFTVLIQLATKTPPLF